jgi:hypothetical protein
LNASGYDPLVSDAFQRLLDASGYNPTSPIARWLGVRYIISDKPYEWSGLTGGELLAQIAQEGEWRVYEVAGSLPRVFMATLIQVMADDESARQLLASGAVSPVVTAIVDHEIECASDPSPQPRQQGGGEIPMAQISRYTPNTVEITVKNNISSILVLTDSYDPNWTVTIDGAPADLLRVDTALRGVCLPAGEHGVRFDYQPRAFYTGVILSAAGWLTVEIIGLMMFVRARRRRLNQDARDSL